MSITENNTNSYAGIIEYSWTGDTTDDLDVSIEAIGAHLQVVQISFNLVGTGTETMTATINHADGGDSDALDTEYFAQDMTGQTEVLQRWANDAGIYIPKGSATDFAWTNTEELAWGLSVLVRNE